MQWVKLWTDMLGDPKVRRAVRDGAKHLQLLPWLIAVAGRADDEGRLTVGGKPLAPEDIAPDVPNATPRQIAGCLRELRHIGIVEEDESGILRFTTWSARQTLTVGEPRSASAERMRRLRERKKRELAQKRETENADRRDGSRDVTSDARRDGACDVTSDGREEEDTEQMLRVTSQASHVTTEYAAPNGATRNRRTSPAVERTSPDVDAVMSHYGAVHPKRRPGNKERAVIRKALALGYPPAELCEAIDGNAADEWHRAQGKHELAYVLRDSGKIDDFRARAITAAPKSVVDPETGLLNGVGMAMLAGSRR